MARKSHIMRRLYGVTDARECGECAHFIAARNRCGKCPRCSEWHPHWPACGLFEFQEGKLGRRHESDC